MNKIWWLTERKSDEYDEIENKVREEYNNNDFSNSPNGLKGFGIEMMVESKEIW